MTTYAIKDPTAPASDKQTAWLTDLAATRDATGLPEHLIDALAEFTTGGTITKQQASDLITNLKVRPKIAKTQPKSGSAISQAVADIANAAVPVAPAAAPVVKQTIFIRNAVLGESTSTAPADVTAAAITKAGQAGKVLVKIFFLPGFRQRQPAWMAHVEDLPPVALQPVAEPAPAKVTEDGMYRNPETGTIYKVLRSPNTGHLYAKRLVVLGPKSAKFVYAGGAMKSLTAAMKLTLDQAKEFGALYGSCACCGRTLTDEKSIALGIGPICAQRYF